MPDPDIELSRVSVLCAHLARTHGMRVGVYHEDDHQYLQIDLPTGQIRFALHPHDPSWTIFGPDMDMVNDFDGVDGNAKWDRIQRFISAPHQTSDQYVIASFRKSMANLEQALVRSRDQRADSARMFRLQRGAKNRLSGIIGAFWSLVEQTPEVDSRPLHVMWEKAKNLVDARIRASEEKEDPSR